jgi:hypothetical protein
MKKLFILFVVMLLASSCTCLLSQIPPQYVFVGPSCTAILPDYTTDEYVHIEDNCGIKSVTQTPEAGTILTAANPTVTVTIRATDLFDNFNEVSFLVTAKDSIPPTITATGLLTDNWSKINNMYDQADRMVAEQEAFFDETVDWEGAGIPEELRTKDQYNKKMLLTWTSPSHATTGYGSRVFTFVSPNDTFTIK